MRTLLGLLASLCSAATLTAAQPESPKVRLEEIPAEFTGRWVASRDECATGGNGWLTIDRLHLTTTEEWSFIVTKWLVGKDQLEFDLTWRGGKGQPPTGRYTRRYTFSPDRRTIIDDSNGVARVRCDD